MKNKNALKAFVLLTSLLTIPTIAAESFCSTTTHSGTSVTKNSNAVGKIGDIGYELWYDHATSGSATFYSDGSMSCSFQNAGDYLCRSGLSLNSDKTFDQYDGDIYAEFKLVKQNISGVDYSYVGVYGWMQQTPGTHSLVEYYVVDNWLSQYRPGDWVASNGEIIGDRTIDGATYTVYRNVRTGPAIGTSGNATFYQYFSIRKEARDCGTINVSAHMRAWKEAGFGMGKLYEVKVLGEAGANNGGVSGTADFPHTRVYIGSASQNPSSSSGTLPSSSSSIAVEQSAYSSNALPGTIEFENYDNGGEGVGFHESDPEDEGGQGSRNDGVDVIGVGSGLGVGYNTPGEWLQYTIDVANTGTYDFEISAANGGENPSTITLSIDGTDVGTVDVANVVDDWGSYSPVTGKTSSITAGKHVLRVTFTTGYVNVDNIKFTANAEILDPLPNPTDAIKFKTAINYERQLQVFDMQGKFLGQIKIAQGVQVQEVLRSRFQKSGMFMIKQGNFIQQVVVK